jgi:hypothetical protein
MAHSRLVVRIPRNRLAAINSSSEVVGNLTPKFSCKASLRLRVRSASFNSSLVSCNVR